MNTIAIEKDIERVPVEIIDSIKPLSSLNGRFMCILLKSNGYLKILYDYTSVELSIAEENVQVVKQWALRDKGTLTLSINETVTGYILNVPIKED
jgi:hypothetical protein